MTALLRLSIVVVWLMAGAPVAMVRRRAAAMTARRMVCSCDGCEGRRRSAAEAAAGRQGRGLDAIVPGGGLVGLEHVFDLLRDDVAEPAFRGRDDLDHPVDHLAGVHPAVGAGEERVELGPE